MRPTIPCFTTWASTNLLLAWHSRLLYGHVRHSCWHGTQEHLGPHVCKCGAQITTPGLTKQGPTQP